MRFIKLIILLLFIAFIVIFFMQNTDAISQPMALHLNLYIAGWSLIALPYYFFLLGAFIIGALLAGLFFIMEKIQHYSALRTYRNKIEALQTEVQSLRKLTSRPKYPLIESGPPPSQDKTVSPHDREKINSEAGNETTAVSAPYDAEHEDKTSKSSDREPKNELA